jgi:molecular chaperone DnaK (HSP70)
MSYGFDAERSREGVRADGFKKLLDVSNSGMEVREGAIRKTEEITQDYLECIYSHFIRSLKETSQDWDEARVQFSFVFTCPATWKEQTRWKFKQIVRKTNFCKHQLDIELSEPQAAAIQVLDESGRSIAVR